MDSRSLIDAQFDRAVEIVQGLPKTGPIQTGYEEKLTMYSLYKQATVGNVRSPRPGIWDMLGRAKWDAWAQHKDLDQHEAKWLYVEALLKVLRKYSDKTVAMDLVRELESYGGDASNLVLSRTLSGASSTSSGSTISEDHAPRRLSAAQPLLPGQRPPQSSPTPNREFPADSSSEDGLEDEEPAALPPAKTPSEQSYSQLLRPQSSLSGRQYRTPMGSSLTIMSPPPPNVPPMQPMPVFETPSAFAENTSNTGVTPPSYYRPPSRPFSAARDPRIPTPPRHPSYPTQPTIPPYAQDPRSSLERALESVQAHVAALTERLEVLELRAPARRSTSSLGHPSSPHQQERDGLFPLGRQHWDMEDWGMWSLVLNPVSRCLAVINQLTKFFTNTQTKSPALTIIRRLALDVSFLVCVLSVIKLLWRRSGLRRREVLIALIALWRAIVGSNSERQVDKGV